RRETVGAQGRAAEIFIGFEILAAHQGLAEAVDDAADDRHVEAALESRDRRASAWVEPSEPRIRRISTSRFCCLKNPWREATHSGPKPKVLATTLARSLTGSCASPGAAWKRKFAKSAIAASHLAIGVLLRSVE